VSGGPEQAISYLEYIVVGLLDKTDSMWFDINRGWSVGQALRVVQVARSLGVGLYLEQPCETYEQCRDVMHAAGIPVIMDECIVDMNDLSGRPVKASVGCRSRSAVWAV
jgi:hypothetical protein